MPLRRRAYPRTSGATSAVSVARRPIQGLSPHERGNHHEPSDGTGRCGPIPARAGQPRGNCTSTTGSGAYPRTSGATCRLSALIVTLLGLSPHERGNLRMSPDSSALSGPIPARAGQPACATRRAKRSRAYPRTSGATEAHQWLTYKRQGLSPHERGNRQADAERLACVGPIPARAGQPSSAAPPRPSTGAYPRTSGATAGSPAVAASYQGLSPHERGNPARANASQLGQGPIPARAGQPRSRATPTRTTRAYPRTSGATSCTQALGLQEKTATYIQILKELIPRCFPPSGHPHSVNLNQFTGRGSQMSQPNPAHRVQIPPNHDETPARIMRIPVLQNLPSSIPNARIHTRRDKNIHRYLQHNRGKKSMKSVRYISRDDHHQRHPSLPVRRPAILA